MEQAALLNSWSGRSVMYPLAGALLAAGAPLGLLSLRRFVLRGRVPIREDIRRDLATYAYLTTSTTLVFTLLGRALGRYEDRLAKLSATDAAHGTPSFPDAIRVRHETAASCAAIAASPALTQVAPDARTVITGHSASRMTRSATLPMSRWVTPPRP